MIKKLFFFALFFVFFSSIYGGMNYYVYLQLVNHFNIVGGLRLMVQFAFWLFASSYILGKIIKRGKFIFYITYLGAIWMGCLSISVFVFILRDTAIYFMPNYSMILENLAVVLIPVLIIASIINALKGPIVKEVEVKPSKNLEKSLNIIHLSDIHLNVMTSVNWLKGIVNKVNSLKPDIIVITGDLVDDEYSSIEAFASTMKGFKAKHGVFAVSGNHEVYVGIENFKNFCRAADIKVIDNTSINLEGINLIGVSDMYRRKGKDNLLIEGIVKACDLSKYNILLCHEPIHFKNAVEKGIDLQLSGHTHRGQIPPLNFLVPFVYRYTYGLYRYKNSFIYTTSGTGTWGPPMRLFSDSEIVSLKLTN
ncbi:metallophosphoesterase [Alkaliphilus pronyensis]|nr:metallophosphoesterase [Alkaliphilus pronyensis]